MLQLNLLQARQKSPISLISPPIEISLKVLAVIFQYLKYFQYSFLYSLCIHFIIIYYMVYWLLTSTICDRMMPWPHLWCVGDTALAARPRTRAVQNSGANVTFKVLQDSAQRYLGPLVAVADLFGRRALRSPSRAAHQAVYLWQPCLSGCRSSSLERSARGRRLIVSSLQTFRRQLKLILFNFHILTWFWPFDWHRTVTMVSVVMFVI